MRDYVHVADIAHAHVLALQKMNGPGFHDYNIGTGRSHSVREICQAAEKISKRKIRTCDRPRRPGDPPVLCADPGKIIEELSWAPNHSDLDEIVTGAWEWEQTLCSQLATGSKVAT